MSEVADDAMSRVLESASMGRCLGALLTLAAGRSPVARGKAVCFLFRLVAQRPGELRGLRDLDGLLARLPKMLGDHTPEARSFGRQLVRLLLSKDLVSRAELTAHLTDEELERAMDRALDVPWQTPAPVASSASKRSGAGVASRPPPVAVAAAVYLTPAPVPEGAPGSTKPPVKAAGGSRRVTRRPAFNGSEAKQQVSDLLKEACSTVWTTRIEALSGLVEAMRGFGDSGSAEATKYSLSCLDLVLEKIEDGNVKVRLLMSLLMYWMFVGGLTGVLGDGCRCRCTPWGVCRPCWTGPSVRRCARPPTPSCPCSTRPRPPTSNAQLTATSLHVCLTLLGL